MQEKLRQRALQAALGEILSNVPEDLSEGSPFMKWLEDTSGELARPEDMDVWEPLENYDDDWLRDLISNSAGARFHDMESAIKSFVPLTKIIVVLEGGIVRSVLTAEESDISVAIIDYDKNADFDDLIEIPQDNGKKATALAAIHEPEVIEHARIDELYNAVMQHVSISEIKASLDDAAAIAAKKESYTLADPSVDHVYDGKVMGITGHHVVLSLGLAALIVEQVDIDRVPTKSEEVVVKFKGGKGLVEPMKSKEVVQGR